MFVSNFSLPRRFAKTLLVCSERRAAVERQLQQFGCRFTKVRDGNGALLAMRHKTFDAAILMSTGAQMDMVETILNLRDMRPAMPVIVLTEPADSKATQAAQKLVARAIPEIPILTLNEFAAHLQTTTKESTKTKSTAI